VLHRAWAAAARVRWVSCAVLGAVWFTTQLQVARLAMAPMRLLFAADATNDLQAGGACRGLYVVLGHQLWNPICALFWAFEPPLDTQGYSTHPKATFCDSGLAENPWIVLEKQQI
jgi:hypothetical protein